MRLTPQQRQVIHDATAELFGEEARVRLFGSRLDDGKKGGDIDLLVECPAPVEGPGRLAARLAARVQRRIGERKIDVLYLWPGMPRLPVHEQALKQGVVL